MSAQITGPTGAKQSKSLDFDVLPSSLPSLPSDLLMSYNLLNDELKVLFIKVFKYLWGVVNGYNIRRSGVMSYYWALYGVAGRSSLAPSSLVVLSYLYMMTNKGAKSIHSDILYNCGVLPGAMPRTVQRVVWDLKHDGYITRHTKDPGQPYSQRAQHNKQPVFIKLTSKGVQCIEGIEKDINRLLLNTSLNDLTGMSNKKPG